MDFIAALHQEHTRSVAKYPQHLWSDYSWLSMAKILLSETCELLYAMVRRDIHGPHGIIAESTQVANVARRIAEEISRRTRG